jgi:hypothetical protein
MNKHRIIVYGSGQLGSLFLKLATPYNVNIVGFIDKYSKQKFCDGLPVYNLDVIPKELLDCHVVICAFKCDNPESIVKDLESLGFTSSSDAYDLLYNLKGSSFYNGWRFGRSKLNSQQNHIYSLILKAMDCNDSKKLYQLNMAYRSSAAQNTDFANQLTEESEKYSNKIVQDFININAPSTIIDGGAWDFTLFQQLSRLKNTLCFDSYIAFDPLPCTKNSYDQIKSFIKSRICNVDYYQTALVGKNLSKKEYFYNYKMGMASRIVTQFSKNSERVKTSFLSNYIPQNCSSLIKLHIEGMEYPVLKEFFDYLPCKYRHLLMINCSHTPEGLIHIPYYLVSRGCSIYYKQHAFYGEGLTLYALTQSNN